MNFILYESRISFDANGNIRKGYAIVIWNWNGLSRAFSAIGTFSVKPDGLSIDQGKNPVAHKRSPGTVLHPDLIYWLLPSQLHPQHCQFWVISP